MSKLTSIIKSTGIIAGTGLAGYYGIELGQKIGSHVPQAYMLGEMTQGLTAFLAGSIGNYSIRKILGTKSISDSEAHSISALNAFASASNESRKISTEQSLKNIGENLVEVIVKNGKTISRGSGMMITTDGYVITAHHVIEDIVDNDCNVFIKQQNGVTYKAPREHACYNKHTDIAIIKAEVPSVRSRPIAVKIDQDCNIKRGDEVRILGYRDGQQYNTMGMITVAKHNWKRDEKQTIYDLFCTDARGKEGQSGGIIANSNGELVGVVVYSSRTVGEEIGVIGGSRISNAIRYINQIAAKKSAKMF